MQELSRSTQRTFILLGVLALVLLAAFLFNRQLKQVAPVSSRNTAETETVIAPSAYVKAAHIQKFSADGSLEFKAKTPKLEQYTPQNKMVMDSPEIDYNSKHQYKVVANQGTLSQKKDLVLQGDVIIRRLNSQQAMTGEQFTINLQDKTVSSDQAVKLTTLEGVMTANGLHAIVDSEIITFTDRVRGIYVP